MTRGLTVDLGAQARSTLTTVTRDGERCIAVQAIEGPVRSRDVEVLVDRDYELAGYQYRTSWSTSASMCGSMPRR